MTTEQNPGFPQALFISPDGIGYETAEQFTEIEGYSPTELNTSIKQEALGHLYDRWDHDMIWD